MYNSYETLLFGDKHMSITNTVLHCKSWSTEFKTLGVSQNSKSVASTHVQIGPRSVPTDTNQAYQMVMLRSKKEQQ